MHVHCFHWLMLELVSFSRGLFADYVNSHVVKWRQWRDTNLAVRYWYFSHCQYTSVETLELNIHPFWVNVDMITITTVNSSHLGFLFQLLLPRTLTTHSLIYAGLISMYSMKLLSKMLKISYYLFAVFMHYNNFIAIAIVFLLLPHIMSLEHHFM